MSDTNLFRRHFMQLAVGGVVAAPFLNNASLLAAAPSSSSSSFETPETLLNSITDGVYINYNENPLGPCTKAREVLAKTIPLSGRYGIGFGESIAEIVSQQEHVPADYLHFFAGSTVPLHAAAMAFSSKDRAIAYPFPTFDIFFKAPNGEMFAPLKPVPVNDKHQVSMADLLAAAPNAGLYYICNPNNPTGVVTPMRDIEWLLAHKPAGSVVLVDEAYIHYSEMPSAMSLVAQGKDVVVLRTFSKIYGLAGMRLGFAAARPDLLAKLAFFDTNNPPMPAFAAAEASLLDPKLLSERKAYNKAVRDDIFAWLSKRGYKYTPSEASFFMVHVGVPGQQVTDALKKYKVFISGTRPRYPDWVRVSIGTFAEMNVFKAAFEKVMASLS